MFTVQVSEDDFRIVGPDGEEGLTTEYGEIATLAIDGAVYYCQREDAEDKSPVVCVKTVSTMPTVTEDVEFTEEEETPGPVLVETTDTGAPEVVE